MSLSVAVFSLTLDHVCCGYTTFRPIALCKLVFAFKVGCRNMWVLRSLRSFMALVLCPSNIFLWFRSRKVRSKGIRPPFQVRVSVPFLDNHFSNLLTDFWLRFHSLPKLFNYLLVFYYCNTSPNTLPEFSCNFPHSLWIQRTKQLLLFQARIFYNFKHLSYISSPSNLPLR